MRRFLPPLISTPAPTTRVSPLPAKTNPVAVTRPRQDQGPGCPAETECLATRPRRKMHALGLGLALAEDAAETLAEYREKRGGSRDRDDALEDRPAEKLDEVE